MPEESTNLQWKGRSIFYTPDGNFMIAATALGGSFGALFIFELDSNGLPIEKSKLEFKLPWSAINSAAISPDANTLALGLLNGEGLILRLPKA